jgi:hypothetical protein
MNNLFKAGLLKVKVDAGRLDARMTQQMLDNKDAGAAF